MNEAGFFKEKQDDNNDIFSKINQKYLPFWPLFVVTTAISLIIAIIYLRSEIPAYVASAKVLLKDPNKGSDTKILDALNIFGDKKIVDNEIVVLKSNTLMTEVVKSLNLYAGVYSKGKVKIEDLYGYNSPLWVEAIDKNKIQGSGKYSFTMDWVNRFITINNQKIPFDSAISLSNVVYKLKVNPVYNTAVKGKNYFLQIYPPEYIASTIDANLRIVPASNASTVLNASLETTEPEKGKAILKTLFSMYSTNAIEDKNIISHQTLAFIDDRLRLVSSDLDTVEKKIVAYRSSEKAFDLGAQAQTYLSNVKELDQRNTQIDLQLDILNVVNNYIRNKGPNPGTVPALSLITDPTLSALLSKLYESETELAKIKTVVGEQNEAVIQKEQEILKMKRDISENISNIKTTLSASRNFNSGIINHNSGLLTTIPQKERGLMEISRNQAVKNALYTFLLQKREETAISSASTVADLRVIETPSAYGPIKPIAKNYYFTGLVVGFFLSIFLILIKEQLNRKILFRSELEEKGQVPVIGELAQVSTHEPIVILDGKRSVIAEQFRSMRTNLGFIGVNDSNNKTILITSSISGEGKSFVAVNLAISFSLMNKKVALLEMDLRKPRLSKLMKIARDPGISNFLVGKISIEEIIKPTHIHNLTVVSSGPIPPNPAELILRPEFKIMMEELKKRFDYIIIDTAPIGPVSDAQLISDYVDTTLFVVRHDFTPRIFLKMIRTVYEEKKYKNMSVVFNGLKRRGIPLYNADYGGYDYGYGYGYGYGGGYSYGDAYYEREQKSGWVKKLKNLLTNNKPRHLS